MNSRQRVLKSINHKEPDRVPLDFYGFGSEENARAILNFYNCHSLEQIVKLWGIDFGEVSPDYIGPELKKYPDGRYIDIRGVMFNPGGTVAKYVLEDAQNIDDLEKHCWPDANWFDYDGIIKKCNKLKGYCLKHYPKCRIFF